MEEQLQLKWGILGTGNIAKKFTKAVTCSKKGVVKAVASRTLQSAQKFANEFNITQVYGAYEDLIHDKNIDAVYIALPNLFHSEWTLKAAEAKKHVLCEKPITINHTEAENLFNKLKDFDVCVMEAFSYRCHPQTEKLIELVREKIIGEIKLIKADFCFNMGLNYENIRLNNTLAGGSIMDVGCYCSSISKLLAATSMGKTNIMPEEVKAVGCIETISKVDESSSAVLKFRNGLIAILTCSTQMNGKSLIIHGSQGTITVEEPWHPEKLSNIIINLDSGETKNIEVQAESTAFVSEIDKFADFIFAGKKEIIFPAMTHQDSIENMKILDSWRHEIGLTFESEKYNS